MCAADLQPAIFPAPGERQFGSHAGLWFATAAGDITGRVEYQVGVAMTVTSLAGGRQTDAASAVSGRADYERRFPRPCFRNRRSAVYPSRRDVRGAGPCI